MSGPFQERKPIQVEETYPDYGDEVIQRLREQGSSFKLPNYVGDSISMSSSKLQKSMPSPKPSISTPKLRLAQRAFRDSLRVAIFVLLMIVLYNWNLKLFKLGDFQRISSQDEKCTTINRFDFTSKSWHEELTLNNLANVHHQKQICDNYKSEFSQLMKKGVLKAAQGIERLLRDDED